MPQRLLPSRQVTRWSIGLHLLVRSSCLPEVLDNFSMMRLRSCLCVLLRNLAWASRLPGLGRLWVLSLECLPCLNFGLLGRARRSFPFRSPISFRIMRLSGHCRFLVCLLLLLMLDDLRGSLPPGSGR